MAFKEKEARELINRRRYAELIDQVVAEPAHIVPLAVLIHGLTVSGDRGKAFKAREVSDALARHAIGAPKRLVIQWLEALNVDQVSYLALGCVKLPALELFRWVVDVIIESHIDRGTMATICGVSLVGCLQMFAIKFPVWFDFLTLVVDGNLEAREILQRLASYLMLLHPGDLHLIGWPSEEARKISDGNGYDWLFGDNPQAPLRMLVPIDQVKSVQALLEPVNAELRRVALESSPVFEACRLHAPKFEAAIAEAWRAIDAEIFRGIRRGGVDWVRVEIKKYPTLTGIRFFPERPFPATRVRLEFEYPCGVKLGRALIISPDGAREPEDTTVLSHQRDNLFLVWLCVTALRCLLCSEPAVYNGGSGSSTSGRGPAIAPHFRRLPEGCHRTERAERWSNEVFGCLPPEGKTFVSEYEPAVVLADTSPRFTINQALI